MLFQPPPRITRSLQSPRQVVARPLRLLKLRSEFQQSSTISQALPMDVVNAERIGGGEADRNGAIARTIEIRVCRQQDRAKRVGRGLATARHVFPFGFRQQPVGPAGLPRQPLDVCLGVAPADADHRMVTRLLEAGMQPIGAARVLAADEAAGHRHMLGIVDERRELIAGHLEPPDTEWIADGHLHRTFGIVVTRLGCSRAHHEPIQPARQSSTGSARSRQMGPWGRSA